MPVSKVVGAIDACGGRECLELPERLGQRCPLILERHPAEATPEACEAMLSIPSLDILSSQFQPFSLPPRTPDLVDQYKLFRTPFALEAGGKKI